ncbi:MAG: UDP-N-acetylglucosamine 1-carboxyvinyltransferase [Chloroflexi bacterium]|nr:UDP-N-acetylglucosamine 1-carboxyvinyltransferase [Chloroflexota bacterium]
MDRFSIEGGFPLKGTVTPSGNKNAALALLAASLLTDEELLLDNVPRIRDVHSMLRLLADLGVEIDERGDHTLALRARQVRKVDLNPELFAEIRGSVLLAGPMLARCGAVTLPRPGGDPIGRRRVDTHLMALRALGAEISVDAAYDMRAEYLSGADILLDEMSVTATENSLMAAVLARGSTTIRNAASEPHVQDLARALIQMGARIEGSGTNTLRVEGVERLRGGHFSIGPDYIEVGSLIGLAAATHGEITLRQTEPEHLRMITLMFHRLGVEIELRGRDVFVSGKQTLRIVPDVHGAIPKIDDAPWPGFPADLMSIALVVATQAEGTLLIHEKMFESRLYFVDKLISMGANIVLCDPHRCIVIGPSPLHGERLESPDIRAGMALLIAALCARGQSVIRNIGQIDRGYERIEEKLQTLGAHIQRVRD